MKIIMGLDSFAASLDFPASKVGQSRYVSIYSATALGSAGVQLGRTMQNHIDSYCALNSLLFRSRMTLPCTLVLSPLSPNHDGSGGAYHYSCTGTTIYVDVRMGSNGQFEWPVSMAFFVAELVECYEAFQGIGWNCGASNGEALSRVFAEMQCPNTLMGYETAPLWINSDREDFITKTDPTDLNPLSTGCGVAFIYFLYYQLGVNWFKIVASGASTLEETYHKATGKTGGYAAMTEVINRKYPPGTKYPDNGINSDNPFPIR